MRKEMKSAAAVILSLALAGAVLSGCGESRQSGQGTKQGIPTSIAEEDGQKTAGEENREESAGEKEENIENAGTEKAEASAEKPGGYEDNFAVDSEAAKEFAQKIQEAAARKDLDALAELTAFPVYVGLPGVDVVETKEDFLKLGADAVFTDELTESVKMADIDNFQPCMAGFNISDGRTASINFGVSDGALAINGINY